MPVILIIASLYCTAKLYKSQKIKEHLNENEKMCKDNIQELESIILERKIDDKIIEISLHISPCISIMLSFTSIKESTAKISDNFSQGKVSSTNVLRMLSNAKLHNLRHSFPHSCIISTESNVSFKLPVKSSAKALKIYKKSHERRNTLSNITGIPNNQPIYTKENESLSSKAHCESLSNKSTPLPRSLTTDIASLLSPFLEKIMFIF